MNTSIINKDIFLSVYKKGYTSQRRIAADSGLSLGTVNNSIKELIAAGFLDSQLQLTSTAFDLIREHSPKNAIILAAGYGMRMVPINTDIPKGLLNVRGEILIERTIRQLREAGINDIYIVTGYMKEAYAYLIDEFGVELIVNTSYRDKNNLHSLAKACSLIGNSYIIPCDIWCGNNPYNDTELYSWYMVNDKPDNSSRLHVNRKKELAIKGPGGNTQIGIAYISGEDSEKLVSNIKRMCSFNKYDGAFWESALFDGGNITPAARVIPASDAVEINTYEQLRELDNSSASLKADSISIICDTLNIKPDDICNITSLKKGMTNRSFLFEFNGRHYIMRIPGEGSSLLINRKNEADVYRKISPINICDHVLYINPDNGYKLTEFIENARTCDAESPDDVMKCMKILRAFHERGICVDHRFDIFAQLEYYENLRNGVPSVYRDYARTKANVLSLRSFIEENTAKLSLTHIDAIPDNFLFYTDENGKEEVRMIDWEYAGMADVHIDLAMFSIYSYYKREDIDRLIGYYFPEGCSRETVIKIYCYVAVCGLLWSNWCEYKLTLGIEFGEYSLKQYRYAVDFFKIVKKELHELGIEI